MTGQMGEITWAPAWQIRQMLEKNELSCREVAGHLLRRIADLNPTLHAFEVLDEEGAPSRATALDEHAARGGVLGPLHGIPVSVKANVRVRGLRHLRLRSESVSISAFDDISTDACRPADRRLARA